MKAVQISETSVNSYKSTRCYNREDSHLQCSWLFRDIIAIIYSLFRNVFYRFASRFSRKNLTRLQISSFTSYSLHSRFMDTNFSEKHTISTFRVEVKLETVSYKLWYLPTSLNCVTVQESNINIFTAVRTSDLASFIKRFRMFVWNLIRQLKGFMIQCLFKRYLKGVF
jgi:hypothetical protein